jgi:hypothetical protein
MLINGRLSEYPPSCGAISRAGRRVCACASLPRPGSAAATATDPTSVNRRVLAALMGPVAAAAAKAPPVVKAKLGEETWAQVHNGFPLDVPSAPYQCQPQLVNSIFDAESSFWSLICVHRT